MNISNQKLHFGAAYYPEHWPEKDWSEDIRLMQAAGLTVVRMAEFAWSTLQPAADTLNFDWLDRAISLLAAEGIETVLGTPTAAPPAWLVQEYPDLMAVDESGRRVQFGNRCHYCVTSPEFHVAAQHIAKAMAEHFGKNPHIIGWQIDNEYNRVCYCERCQKIFQEYLQDKFGSLEALNEHWSTSYWSQTYSSWEQIPIPRGYHNPGLMLEWKHFISDSYRKFQRLQLDLLRPHLRPEVWITHNFMGWYDGFDHYTVAKDLDLAAWDWYVGNGHNNYLQSGSIHDLTRGFKRRNFWLMETQPGNVNWSPLNNVLDKGEARAMAWHALAHGAEALLYWQWRSALGGQEQYHGTLVDQSGQPRPFYAEAQLVGQDLKAVSDLVAGSVVKSPIAMLNCYDSRWAIGWQRHNNDFDYLAHFNHYYRSLAARNVNVDIISADDPLEGYKLVVAPALLILNEKRVKQLKEFVRNGGFLVLTLRTGMKDKYNALLPSRQPGALAELAGLEVEEYYALPDPIPVKGKLFKGTVRLWAERLKLLDGNLSRAMARYGDSNGWLDDQVAVAIHPYGNGMVYYVGAWLDETSQQVLIDHILLTAEIHSIPTPPGVEMRTRVKNNTEEIHFVINHSRAEQTVHLPWAGTEHLSQQAFQGEIKLSPYGVAILTKKPSDDSA
ncbi:MAG: beta-galactosidase [Anaerolineales bacterium]